MADNLNTFKNIGDTVSFDSLYRGIENMGKAIASARAAKAKADAKKNDELMKMVYQKNMETGKTPLQGIRNLQDYTSFLSTATNNIASNPNTGMNTVNLLFADYLTKSQLTTQQSNEEKKIRDGYSEGKAVSPEVINAFDKAYEAGGNMQWFTDPNNQLDLARQGIYVTPDKSSEIDVNGKKFYQWGYISTSLSKAKNLTDELNTAAGNISNYDVTSEVENVKDLQGGKRGQQTVGMAKKYTLKPGKKEEIADQYSNDTEIQRFYLVNKDLFDYKVQPNLTSIQNLYPNMSLQEQLGLAAKQAIKSDVLAHNFDYKDPSTQVLAGPNVTNVTVNNQPQWVVSNKSSEGDKDILIPGGTSKDIDWTADRLKAARNALKNGGGNMVEFVVPGTGKGAGKTVMVYIDKQGAVQSGYTKKVKQQNAGMQSNFINQKDFNAQSLEFRPGFTQGVKGNYYDPLTMEKIPQNQILKVSNKWQINDYVKIDGVVYVSVNPVVPDNKDINIGEALIPVTDGDFFDDLGSKMYKTDSMTRWKGWKDNASSTNNASSININD
jgi:hypothetical protein